MPMSFPLNAKAPYPLYMTQEDIDIGIPLDPFKCPAVVGLKRHPDILDAEVWRDRAFILFGPGCPKQFEENQWYRFRVPASLKVETQAGDRGGKMIPGMHVFMPLPKSKRATGKRQGSSTNENGKQVTVVNPSQPESKIGRRNKWHLIPGIRPPKTY